MVSYWSPVMLAFLLVAVGGDNGDSAGLSANTREPNGPHQNHGLTERMNEK